jgi:hypothetical protein
MDSILYNVLGYATEEYTARAATMIQKAYRNHRSYELGWRADRLQGLVPTRDGTDTDEELEYWNEQRAITRHELQWVII